MGSSSETPMLDCSLLLDDSELEELEDVMDEVQTTVYVSKSFADYVRNSDSYRGLRKSSLINYFYSYDQLPPLDGILDFLSRPQVSTYSTLESQRIVGEERLGNEDQVNGFISRSELRASIDEAVGNYPQRFPEYDILLDILLDEISYLFSSSLLLAANNEIRDTVEEVNGTIINVGEDLRETALNKAVKGQNIKWDTEEEVKAKSEYIEKAKVNSKLIKNCKLAIFAVSVSGLEKAVLDFQIPGEGDIFGAIGYTILGAILENTISERLIIAADP